MVPASGAAPVTLRTAERVVTRLGEVGVSGLWRLALVAAVTVGAFIAAIVSFKDIPATECQFPAVRDRSYKVSLEEPPNIDMTYQRLVVTHNGQLVSGALVCLRADMGGRGRMSGMGVSNQARETTPGHYDVPVRFLMSGHWDGTAIVTEPRRKAVAIPLSIEVR